MNILYDYHIFHAQRHGGISRYFYELAKHLSAREDCSIEIFAPLHINEYLDLTSDIRLRGIKIKNYPFSGYIRRSINNALTRILITRRSDLDIFHETFYSGTDHRPHSAKGLITVHDMIHEKFAEYFPGRDITTKIKAAAVNRADHVICVSENTRRDLIELLRVPEEKTSVVYHGYSLSGATPAVYPITGRKPFILYVGHRDGYKNYQLLLRAYASSKSLRNEVPIICFGGGEITAHEKDLMALLNLPPDCVQYMEGNDSVLAGLYASASVFVYPSLYEGFGIPPLEAMALGCPVVCSNTGSIPEVVGNSARLFDPESESDLRSAMEEVVFSPEHAERLKAKGFDRIKMFSWEKCAQDTLAVYKKVSGN
ncbi:glycosyltransferase family 4 protein [Desulfosudis oleivorans]|uniref:Glycosyl transferase group 1 n=1 Tax=Desulfosudis oleivorans (strain DSM 6200 / JCM 39069 / Hxd3) TaxID=96561 RepID=A8ZU26_DESOH|nr:glycosyltransferase family 1 protein [Desulfosudis oleivorans]ABW66338.1 glycosyl transferase group 1 [Desulfosudis oleivorans Hxd3]